MADKDARDRGKTEILFVPEPDERLLGTTVGDLCRISEVLDGKMDVGEQLMKKLLAATMTMTVKKLADAWGPSGGVFYGAVADLATNLAGSVVYAIEAARAVEEAEEVTR